MHLGNDNKNSAKTQEHLQTEEEKRILQCISHRIIMNYCVTVLGKRQMSCLYHMMYLKKTETSIRTSVIILFQLSNVMNFNH